MASGYGSAQARNEQSEALEGEQVVAAPVEAGPRPRGRSRWRVLRLGCLGLMLFMCAGLGVLGYALHSGPVSLQFLGGNKLKIGSSDFVLVNSSFQDGTTYFIDLDGNGVRNILQLDYLSKTNNLNLVLHYASRSEVNEHSLATVHLP